MISVEKVLDIISVLFNSTNLRLVASVFIIRSGQICTVCFSKTLTSFVVLYTTLLDMLTVVEKYMKRNELLCAFTIYLA